MGTVESTLANPSSQGGQQQLKKVEQNVGQDNHVTTINDPARNSNSKSTPRSKTVNSLIATSTSPPTNDKSQQQRIPPIQKRILLRGTVHGESQVGKSTLLRRLRGEDIILETRTTAQEEQTKDKDDTTVRKKALMALIPWDHLAILSHAFNNVSTKDTSNNNSNSNGSRNSSTTLSFGKGEIVQLHMKECHDPNEHPHNSTSSRKSKRSRKQQQLQQQQNNNGNTLTNSNQTEEDFMILMIDPTKQSSLAYAESIINERMESCLQRIQSEKEKDKRVILSKLSICILLNFYDLEQKQSQENKNNNKNKNMNNITLSKVKAMVRNIVQNPKESQTNNSTTTSPDNHTNGTNLMNVQCYEACMKNGYGLQHLNNFMAIPYLQKQQINLELELQRVTNGLHDWMDCECVVPEIPMLSYDDFERRHEVEEKERCMERMVKKEEETRRRKIVEKESRRKEEVESNGDGDEGRGVQEGNDKVVKRNKRMDMIVASNDEAVIISSSSEEEYHKVNRPTQPQPPPQQQRGRRKIIATDSADDSTKDVKKEKSRRRRGRGKEPPEPTTKPKKTSKQKKASTKKYNDPKQALEAFLASSSDDNSDIAPVRNSRKTKSNVHIKKTRQRNSYVLESSDDSSTDSGEFFIPISTSTQKRNIPTEEEDWKAKIFSKDHKTPSGKGNGQIKGDSSADQKNNVQSTKAQETRKDKVELKTIIEPVRNNRGNDIPKPIKENEETEDGTNKEKGEEINIKDDSGKAHDDEKYQEDENQTRSSSVPLVQKDSQIQKGAESSGSVSEEKGGVSCEPKVGHEISNQEEATEENKPDSTTVSPPLTKEDEETKSTSKKDAENSGDDGSTSSMEDNKEEIKRSSFDVASIADNSIDDEEKEDATSLCSQQGGKVEAVTIKPSHSNDNDADDKDNNKEKETAKTGDKIESNVEDTSDSPVKKSMDDDDDDVVHDVISSTSNNPTDNVDDDDDDEGTLTIDDSRNNQYNSEDSDDDGDYMVNVESLRKSDSEENETIDDTSSTNAADQSTKEEEETVETATTIATTAATRHVIPKIDTNTTGTTSSRQKEVLAAIAAAQEEAKVLFEQQQQQRQEGEMKEMKRSKKSKSKKSKKDKDKKDSKKKKKKKRPKERQGSDGSAYSA